MEIRGGEAWQLITNIKGDDGANGSDGAPGPAGAVFTPSVSASGDLSWTNNGGLENPTTVNIMGPKGDTGATGPQGETGATGPRPSFVYQAGVLTIIGG